MIAAIKLYAYAVVETDGPTPVPVHVALTRKACRDWVKAHPAPATLRVRRGKLTLFES